MIDDDEPAPFERRLPDEFGAEDGRGSQPPEERPRAASVQRPLGGGDGQAAGKQTDRRPDREFQYLRRRRTSLAGADIKQIRDDEDREERGLCDDQASHADPAAIGSPLAFHSYLQSGSPGCFRSHSGRLLRTSGTVAKS